MEFSPLKDVLQSNDESLLAAIRYNPKMFYNNSCRHPNKPFIISIPVNMTLPYLFYHLNTCARTSFTVCCILTFIKTFINVMIVL